MDAALLRPRAPCMDAALLRPPYAPRAVGVNPSAMRCEARLHGL